MSDWGIANKKAATVQLLKGQATCCKCQSSSGGCLRNLGCLCRKNSMRCDPILCSCAKQTCGNLEKTKWKVPLEVEEVEKDFLIKNK